MFTALCIQSFLCVCCTKNYPTMKKLPSKSQFKKTDIIAKKKLYIMAKHK